ncbi:hypothetical protein [Oceanicola sp. 502str15]|uniref:hypothetical protein n=1 Tax=Oceanicola sp. 502str15 TaxID=2696061 RepID=UPI0020964363|nr:hypothetical protein [Oceanicola sp. 502str15]MCO6382472.1 hypothetical protein [Oceanicola sp. 502str15]
MNDEEMKAADAVATWMEQAPHQTIYSEASDFRKVMLSSFGEDKPKWEQITPETTGMVVNAWLAQERLGYDLPQLEGPQLAKTGQVVREWLTQLEAKVKTPALVSVDDFTGVLHALHCSLRGIDPFEEQKENAERMKNAPTMRSDFNLRG